MCSLSPTTAWPRGDSEINNNAGIGFLRFLLSPTISELRGGHLALGRLHLACKQAATNAGAAAPAFAKASAPGDSELRGGSLALRRIAFSFFFFLFLPFFCSKSERFCVLFPLLFTIRALFVVRSPQSPPEAPQSPATCPDHPLRCAGVRAPSPKHLSPPAVSARLRSKRCLDELGLHGPCGLPPLSGWQGGGRTRLVR